MPLKQRNQVALGNLIFSFLFEPTISVSSVVHCVGQRDMTLFFGKSILIVEESGFLEPKVRQQLANAGTRTIGPLDSFPDVQLALGLFRVDGVIIDLRLDDETIIEVAKLLEHFKIEYLFASINAGRIHPDQFVLSSDINDLANIARALFGSSPHAVTIH
ncbi:hypothetical protein [Agrobacterium pusense]|uniref:hypothetical protein n=1 Tax=Agrobacterium pusense TaxID=648995 RepID=UPI003FD1E9A0